MEFLDEAAETRPRFLFQPRSSAPPPPPPKPSPLHKPTLLISLSLSLSLLSFSLLSPHPEPLQSLLLWLSLSLLLGPFAPSSLTSGPILVGQGKLLLPTKPPPDKTPTTDRRSRPRTRPDEPVPNPVHQTAEVTKTAEDLPGPGEEDRERDWDEGDYELLKKLLAKHPVGKPGRWEAIAEGFKGRNRHGVESVIRAAKSMGERKMNDADSFARFLKDRRKPVDNRVVEEEGEVGGGEVVGESSSVGWSAGDDMALLSALKVVPKDAPMRWEKVAAAVPGKSRAGCVKRVAELKKGFRSSKASANSGAD